MVLRPIGSSSKRGGAIRCAACCVVRSRSLAGTALVDVGVLSGALSHEDQSALHRACFIALSKIYRDSSHRGCTKVHGHCHRASAAHLSSRRSIPYRGRGLSMNSTWITLSQLRSWHRPALIGQRWKIRDSIVTTNCLEMLYLRDCLNKVGTDFPLRFTKVWPVPIVFFGIVDGIGASRPCESPPDKGAARRLTIEWESLKAGIDFRYSSSPPLTNYHAVRRAQRTQQCRTIFRTIVLSHGVFPGAAVVQVGRRSLTQPIEHPSKGSERRPLRPSCDQRAAKPRHDVT